MGSGRKYFARNLVQDSGSLKGILGAYETDIYRAYGMIDFFTSYSGPCIQVNSSSSPLVTTGNTDILFNSIGEIDNTQLLSVSGGGTLYISKFYDLSGNSRDLSPATGSTRIRIVNAGVIETFNGKTSPFWQANGSYAFLGDLLPHSTQSTCIYVHDLVRTALSIKFGGAGQQFSFTSQQGSTSTVINGTTLPGNTLRADKVAFSGTNRGHVYNFISGKKIVAEYGFSITSGNQTGWNLNNYAGTQGQFINGYQPNILFWDANLGTTDIDAIMDLLNSYYSVY